MEFFQDWLKKNLYKFEYPAVYIGTEPGTERRDWEKAPLRVCLCGTSTYENLTGNLAVPMLVRMLLESRPDWVVERAFFPCSKRDLEIFEKQRIPIFSLESKRRLTDFDVIAFSCLPASAMLLTKDGPKSIADVEEGELVATPSKGLQKIAVKKRMGTKPVVRIRLSDGRELECTEDHRILVRDDRNDHTFHWEEAGNLEIGDAVPKTVHDFTGEASDKQIKRAREANSARKIYKIPDQMSGELAWLLGYMVGDGCVCKDGVHFYYVKEAEGTRILEALKQLFGFEAKPWQMKNCLKVHGIGCYSLQLKAFLLDALDDILNHPKYYRDFISGLVQADGSANGEDKPGYTLTITNEEWARKTFLMAQACGIFATLHVYPQSGKGTKPRWHVYLVGELDLVEKEGRSYRNHSAGVAKVIEVIPAGEQEVYDIHVPEGEEFLANFVPVHNCSFCGTDLNAIKMLDLSRIPVLRKDRPEDEYPWVIRGGQNDSNPSPYMPLYDVMYIGEGELNFVKLLDIMALAKKKAIPKARVKKVIVKLDGVLVPEFYRSVYSDSGRFERWEKTYEEAPLPVSAARTKDMSKYFIYRHPIVNYLEEFGSGELLISKSCLARCSFCLTSDAWIWTKKGLRKLSSVKLGEEVATDAGWRKVIKIWDNGEQDCAELRLRNGISIVATLDHKFREAARYNWMELRCMAASGHLALMRRDWSEIADVAPLVTPEQVVRMKSQTGRVCKKFGAPKEMTEDLAWFLGYCAGDANIRSTGVRILYREDRPGEESKIDLGLACFGLVVESKPYYGTSVKVLMKEVHGVNFALLLTSLIDSIHEHPRFYRLFIEGWLQADGGNNTWAGADLVTTDAEAANKLLYMGWYCGLPCTLHYYPNSHKGRWVLHFKKSPSLIKESVAKTRVKRLGSVKKAPNPEWMSWGKVQSVTPVGKKRVFTFTVEDRHCYISNALVSMNCNEGNKEKPYRELPADIVISAVSQSYRESGATSCVLSAFCVSSYRQKMTVLTRLLEEVTDEVKLTSQRADESARHPEFMNLSAIAGNRSVSFGVEGMSERLRILVNKWACEADILKAIENAIKGGYNKIKLFMISGIPTESAEDREEWVKLAAKVKVVRDKFPGNKVQIKFQFTSLTVTPWTPFQWYKPTTGGRFLSPYIPRIKEHGVGVSFGAGKGGALDYLLQLLHIGDDRLTPVLVSAVLDDGVVYFRQVPRDTMGIVERELTKLNLSLDLWWRDKDKDEPFPWEIVNFRVKRKYLWAQRTLNLQGKQVPKCEVKCTGCGACDGMKLEPEVPPPYPRIKKYIPVDQHLIFKLGITGDHRFVGAATRQQLMRRACYMQDIPIMKHVEVASKTLRANDWVEGIDYAAVRLTSRMKEAPVIASLTAAFDILEVQARRTNAAQILGENLLCHSEILVSHPVKLVRQRLESFLSGTDNILKIRVEGYLGAETKSIAGNEAIKDAWVVTRKDGFWLNVLHSGSISIYDLYAHLLKQRSWREVAAIRARRLDFYMSGLALGAEHCSTCDSQLLYNPFGEKICPRCQGRLEGMAEMFKLNYGKRI